MNIVEAFLKFNHQYVIIISGLLGSGKTEIAKILAKELKFKHVKLEKYFKDNDKKINEIDQSSTELTNPQETPEIELCNYDKIDWHLFNSYVNENKKNGIICSGMIFDNSNIKFKTNYTIHLQISKQQWLEKVKEKLKEKISDEAKVDQEFQELKKKLNADCYSYYVDKIKTMKAQKFVNVTIFNEALLSQEIWDDLMKFTNNSVNKNIS